METIYEKKELAREVLMEYYAYCELRGFLQDDWEKEDEKWKKQCDKLYDKYEKLYKEERNREERSKSGKVAKKLEALKKKDADYKSGLEDTVLLKRLK